MSANDIVINKLTSIFSYLRAARGKKKKKDRTAPQLPLPPNAAGINRKEDDHGRDKVIGKRCRHQKSQSYTWADDCRRKTRLPTCQFLTTWVTTSPTTTRGRLGMTGGEVEETVTVAVTGVTTETDETGTAETETGTGEEEGTETAGTNTRRILTEKMKLRPNRKGFQTKTKTCEFTSVLFSRCK